MGILSNLFSKKKNTANTSSMTNSGGASLAKAKTTTTASKTTNTPAVTNSNKSSNAYKSGGFSSAKSSAKTSAASMTNSGGASASAVKPGSTKSASSGFASKSNTKSVQSSTKKSTAAQMTNSGGTSLGKQKSFNAPRTTPSTANTTSVTNSNKTSNAYKSRPSASSTTEDTTSNKSSNAYKTHDTQTRTWSERNADKQRRIATGTQTKAELEAEQNRKDREQSYADQFSQMSATDLNEYILEQMSAADSATDQTTKNAAIDNYRAAQKYRASQATENIGDNPLAKFYSEYQNVVDSIANYTSRVGDSYEKDYGALLDDDIVYVVRDLGNSAYEYVANHADEFADPEGLLNEINDIAESLVNQNNNFAAARDYYSQWSSAEEYKAAQSAVYDQYGAAAGKSVEDVNTLIQSWENGKSRTTDPEIVAALDDRINKANAYLDTKMSAEEFKVKLDELEKARDEAKAALNGPEAEKEKVEGSTSLKDAYNEAEQAYQQAKLLYDDKVYSEAEGMTDEELAARFAELDGKKGVLSRAESDEIARIQRIQDSRALVATENAVKTRGDYNYIKNSINSGAMEDHWSALSEQNKKDYRYTRGVSLNLEHKYMRSYAFTEDEKQTYNYIYEKDGEEAAQDYIDALSEERLDERVAKYEAAKDTMALTGKLDEEYVNSLVDSGLTELAQAYLYYAEEKGYTDQSAAQLAIRNALYMAGARGKRITSAPLSTVAQVGQYLGGLARGDYNSVNPYASYASGARSADLADSLVAENFGNVLQKWMTNAGASSGVSNFAGAAGRVVMSGVQSGLDMLIGAGIGKELSAYYLNNIGKLDGMTVDAIDRVVNEAGGKVYGYLMGSNVATSSITEAVQNGHSASYAIANGLIRGTIEGITEKYSIDTILNKTNSMKAFRNFAKSAVAEGSEEIASNILNWGADYLMDGDQAELTKNYRQYVADGMTSDEALAQIIWDCTKENIESAAAAVISVAMMGPTAFKNASKATQNVRSLVDLGTKYYDQNSSVYAAAKNLESLMDTAHWNITEANLEQKEISDFMTELRADPTTPAVLDSLTADMANEETVTLARTLSGLSGDLGHVVNSTAKRLIGKMDTKSALQQADLIDSLRTATSIQEVDKVLDGGLLLTNESVTAEVNKVLSDIGIRNNSGKALGVAQSSKLSAPKTKAFLHTAFDTYFNAVNAAKKAVEESANEMERRGVEQIVASSEQRVANEEQAAQIIESATEEQKQDADTLTQSLLNGKQVEFEENGKKTSVSAAEFVAQYLQNNPNATVDDAARVLRESLRYNDENGAIPGVAASTMSEEEVVKTIEGAYNGKRGVDIRIGEVTARTGTDTKDKLTSEKFDKGATVGGDTYKGVSVDGYVSGNDTFSAVSEKTLKNPKADFKRALRIGEALYERLGIRVVFYEGTSMNASGRFLQGGGAYTTIDGQSYIFLDVNAGIEDVWSKRSHITYTLAHELVHYFKENSETAYTDIYDYVDIHLFNEDKAKWEAERRRFRMSPEYSHLSNEELDEEIVAEAMSSTFYKSDSLKAFLGTAYTLKQFGSISDVFHSLADKLRLVYNDAFAKKDIKGMSDLYTKGVKSLNSAVSIFNKARDAVLAEQSRPSGRNDLRNSIKMTSAALGVDAFRDEKTGVITFTVDGKPVAKITADHIKDKSGIGALIQVAVANGFITKRDAEQQYKAAADLMDTIMKTNDPPLTWAWAGASLFSALKKNADKQYGTTIDFTTVCRKTQEMVTAMSEAMKRRHKGLTKYEVTQLQKRVIAAGGDVNCPVCYVFSRWAGIGGMLDEIKGLQQKYSKMSQDEIRDRVATLEKDIIDRGWAKKQKSGWKISGEAVKKLIQQKNDERDDYAYELELLQQKGEKQDRQNELTDLIASLDADMSVLGEWTWASEIFTREDYKPVPLDILYDLDAGREFAENYAAVWKYRTTRGPSAGKAILPYSDMRLGDIILGAENANAGAERKTIFSDRDGNVLFTGKPTEEQRNAIKRAVERTAAQNLIGGQRYQSTSDFRYEYALDYIQSFWELQALGSKLQTYTKVVEYADLIASIGGDVNLSVMPKGKGYDGGILIYSNVTGMNIDAALEANAKFDNAQLILVGINDEHIRLALDDNSNSGGEFVGFVIPYHASGASIEKFISELVQNLGEDFVKENYKDYSDIQGDKQMYKIDADKLTDEAAAAKRIQSIRKRILQNTSRYPVTAEEVEFIRGKSVNITNKSFEYLRSVELAALNGDEKALKEYLSWSAGVLSDLYDKMTTGSEKGVKLTSDQAETIMPHEYWNKKTTRANAYVNGFIFRSYCYRLGLRPRFTGWTSGTAKAAYGDFSDSTGYWKTLIDRPMYTNAGKYRDQNRINVTGFKEEMLKPEYAERVYPKYKIQEPDTRRAKEVGAGFAKYLDDRDAEAPVKKQAKGFSAKKQSKVTAEQDKRYIELAKDPEANAPELQKLVDKAALAWGAAVNKGGSPLKLYRGVSGFGHTVFGPNAIFTTPDRTIAQGYGGGKGYANPRKISEQYTPDDGTAETLIKNYKNILHREAREATKSDVETVRKEISEEADRINNLLNEHWTGLSIDVDEETANAIDGVLWLASYLTSDTLDDASAKEIEYELKRFNKNIADVKRFMREHYPELTSEDDKAVADLLLGYDYTDFAIDVRYRLLPSFSPEEYLLSETGSWIDRAALRDSIEQTKDIGSYVLYGNLGDNPLDIDAHGQFWTNVTADGFGTLLTDNLVDEAKKRGYTSVIIRNVMDPAGNNYTTNKAADDYVFFDSSQLKSADPVTYDDAGNVIPLSRRFNTDNKDIRYQSKTDSLGNALSEEQQEYFRNSKVRDDNGNLLVMYHGTSNYGFTVFDSLGKGKYGLFGLGNYFTADKSVAETYQNKGKGNNKGVYSVYLNITNPIDMDADADLKQWRDAFNAADLDTDYLDGCKTNTDCFRALEDLCSDEQMYKYDAEELIMDTLRGMGYDGITHIGGLRRGNGETLHRVYIALDSEQVKSVDNKSPTSDADIRYQTKSAHMTNARIEYLIEDSGAGTKKDYAQKWLTSINPTDFLNLTLKTNDQNRDYFDTVEGDYGETVNDGNYLAYLKKEKRQTPFLLIDENGQVMGHEGRHRMRALEKEGVTSAEVTIEFYDGEDGSLIKNHNTVNGRLETVQSITLSNQYGTGQTAEVRDIVPLNLDHKDELFSKYGEGKAQGEDIRYQAKKAPSKKALAKAKVQGIAQTTASERKKNEAPALGVYGYEKSDKVTSSQSGSLGTVESVDKTGGTAQVSFGQGFAKSAPQTVQLSDMRHAEVGDSTLQSQLERIPDILNAENDSQKALEQIGTLVEALMKKRTTNPDTEAPKPLPTKQLTFAKVKPVSATQNAKDKAAIRSLVKKYGRIKVGETDAEGLRRDVKLPSRVNSSEAVRKFMRTVAESMTVPEKYVSQIERLIADKGPSGLAARYEIISDAAARDYVRTQQERYRNDPNGLLKKFEQWVETGVNDKGNPIGKPEIALGEQLIIEYANIGDVSTTMKLIADVAAIGTRAGQTVQALHLLKMMTPSGKLYYAQRAVDNMNRAFGKRKKLGRNGSGIITIDPALAKAILEAQTQDALDSAMDAMLQDIADQIPPNAAELWTAWRYLAMLGNPRTHVRNFLGNALFAPAKLLKDTLAATGELALKKGNRTKSFKYLGAGLTHNLRQNDPIVKYATEDFALVQDELRGTGKHNIADEIRSRRKPFGKKGGLLNKISEFNSNALDMGDVLFMKRYYIGALAGFIQARGLDVNNMDERQLATARQYATTEAQKATYRDFSKFANALSKFSRSGWVAHLIAEGIMPFKKTPVNILKRGVEYSPAGILKTVGSALQRGIKYHEHDPARFIDDLASNLSGSLLFGLGMLLARSGRIRRGDDDEKRENLMKAMGYQDFSATIDWIDGEQYNITLDWVAPASMPFFMGVALYDMIKGDNELSSTDLYNALLFMASPVFSLSLLDGVNGVLESAKYATGVDAIVKVAADVTYDYFGQGFWTLAGQFNRIIDPTRRTTYTDPNSVLPDGVQGFLQSVVFSKTPGLSFLRPAYHDVWGRRDISGNIFLRALENLISPAYVQKIDVSPMEEELLRLYEATNNSALLPSKPEHSIETDDGEVELSADQYSAYAEAYGSNAYDMLTELMSTEAYQAADDVLRARIIDNVYNLAGDMAKADAVDGYAMSDINVKAISGEDYDPLDVLTVYSAASETLVDEKALSADTVKTVLEKCVAPLLETEEDKWAQGKTDDILKNAYNAGNLTRQQAQAYLVKYMDKDEDDAFFTIERWEYNEEKDEGDDTAYSEYLETYNAVYAGKGVDAAIKTLTSHGYEEKKVYSSIRTRVAQWYSRTATDGKTVSREKARELLIKYAAPGTSNEDAIEAADEKLHDIDFVAKHEEADGWSHSEIIRYEESGKDISLAKWEGVCETVRGFTGSDRQSQIRSYIESVTSNTDTRRALWRIASYGTSTCPW